MAERHYVDPKDQHIAAEAVPNHSELTSMYPSVQKEKLGDWMQEKDRQKALEAKRDKVVVMLRKSSLLVGLSISAPVILGLLLAQLAQSITIDKGNAMAVVFLMILVMGGFFGLTLLLYRWVGQTYRNHTIRALPISLTTLMSLFFLIPPIFRITGTYIGGLTGYIIGLTSLVVAGVIISTVCIFVWTSKKIPDVGKLLILGVFFGASVAAAYLL